MVIENRELWEMERNYRQHWNNWEKAKPTLWSFRFTFPTEWSMYDIKSFTIIARDQEQAEIELRKILAKDFKIHPNEIRTDQRGYIAKVHFIEPKIHKGLHDNWVENKPTDNFQRVETDLVR